MKRLGAILGVVVLATAGAVALAAALALPSQLIKRETPDGSVLTILAESPFGVTG